MKVQTIGALAVFALAIAACGGGGGGGTAPSGSSVAVLPTAGPTTVAATAAPTSTALPAGYAISKVTLSMPKGTYAASSARKTQAIGVGTESIVFTLLQQNGSPATGAPQVFPLTASSQYCTTNPVTLALNCTLPVGAPIGADVFLAQTYANPDGTGALTGSGAVALSVGQNTSNTASIVLNAQVAAVYVVSGSFYLGNANGYLTSQSSARRGATQAALRAALSSRKGTQQAALPVVNTSPVFVVAVDSSGNTILNPSVYNAPIYLQLAFDPFYGWAYYGGTTADASVTVTYANGDPSTCTGGNTTETASDWYQYIAICSPSDNVTAAILANGGVNPSTYAYIYGYILSNQLFPTPAPSMTPVPLPTPIANSYASIYVVVASPSPSPSGGIIQVQPQ